MAIKLCVTIVTLYIILGAGYANKLPNFITPCNEPTRECLISTVQKAVPIFVKGLPEYGVESLDPMIIKKFEQNLTGNLKVTFLDGILDGFKTCIVNDVEFNIPTIRLDITCNFISTGRYKARGKLLIFDLIGDGEAKIVCKNLRLNVTTHNVLKQRADGRQYIEPKNFTYTPIFDYVHYDISNLISGQPELSARVVEFINREPLLVANEFGKPLLDVSVKNVLNNIKGFFRHVPYSEFFKSPTNE